MDLTIAELLRLPTVTSKWRGEDVRLAKRLSGISTDSRSVQPGNLFFAIKGEVFDAHEFIDQVLQKNISGLVVSHEWFRSKGDTHKAAPIIVVDNVLHAYQELARYYRKKFSLPIIALSGSAGKTTTKEAIFAVLSKKYKVLKNIKSFNNHVGVPATLYNLLSEHEILLTEMGTNHFGELERLSYLVEPDVCLLTNIGYAHLEFFKNLDGVARAKMEIFAHAQPNATAIYNADDLILAAQDYPASRTISFGLNSQAEIRGRIKGCDDLACYTFELAGQMISLRVPGRHNVYNALAAAAVGMHFSMDLPEIKSGLESFVPVDNRMQVMKIGEVTVINDSYNSNPSSCAAAIASAGDMKVAGSGRKIAVLGDMLELGEFSQREHENLADRVAEQRFDALFLFGKATEATAAKAQERSVPFVVHFNDKEILHQEIVNFVHANDLVLVKGSRGMRMESVVESLKNLVGNQNERQQA